ncbi:MAG: hypothetical protein FWD45_02665 [Coriobacteriia bacterium]|nr:hypothetical protein [Coriobacteriia bacterium]
MSSSQASNQRATQRQPAAQRPPANQQPTTQPPTTQPAPATQPPAAQRPPANQQPAAQRQPASQNFAGFTYLVRFILRRDRFYLPCWLIGLASMACLYVPEMNAFLGSEQSAQVLIEMTKNPAMIAIMGIPYGHEVGPLYAQFMLVYTALTVGIFNIMFVVRHTRKDEEEGRSEILASLPVGRSASLLAVTTVALAANILIGIVITAIFAALAIEGMNVQGALVFGFAIAATGLTYAGLAALIAQLCSTAKATTSSSLIILGVSYLIRAYGDMQDSSIALLSPLGVAQRVQAWAGDKLWPIALLTIEAALLLLCAFVLISRRDSAAGLLPAKDGRRHASPLLSNELALAWRLTRSTCIIWLGGLFTFGAMFGLIFPEMVSFFETNDLYRQIIGIGITDTDTLIRAFIDFLMLLTTVLSAVAVCQVVEKCLAEERRGRTEQLYSKSVSKVTMLGSYTLIALIMAVALQVALALGAYLAASTVTDSAPTLKLLLTSALRYTPALIVFVGLTAILVGLAPKAIATIWAFLVYNFLLLYFGNLIKLPNLVKQLSPMTWVKPGASTVVVACTCLLGFFGVAVALTSYRRRDIWG